jgi:hypothetical protein
VRVLGGGGHDVRGLDILDSAFMTPEPPAPQDEYEPVTPGRFAPWRAWTTG